MERVRFFFKDRDEAITFFKRLGGQHDPVLVTALNQEDVARGYDHPRIVGWFVVHNRGTQQ